MLQRSFNELWLKIFVSYSIQFIYLIDFKIIVSFTVVRGIAKKRLFQSRDFDIPVINNSNGFLVVPMILFLITQAIKIKCLTTAFVRCCE